MNKAVQGRDAFTPLSTPCNSPPTSPDASRRQLTVAWQPLWVLRYNVVDTTRSVVDNLGYIVCGQFSAQLT